VDEEAVAEEGDCRFLIQDSSSKNILLFLLKYTSGLGLIATISFGIRT